MIEAELDRQFTHACVEAIERADAPLTVSDLRRKMGAPFAFRERQEKAVERLLEERAEKGELHVWPPAPRSRRRRFWRASFADGVADRLMQVLAEAPATPKQVIERVHKLLPRVTGANADAEARRQLQKLAAEEKLIDFRASRQTNVYFSRVWLTRFAPPPPDALSEAALLAIAQLESQRGNYVLVDEVRASAVVKKAFDRTALQLARAGRLVLGGYDGPRPIPEERRHEFIEDDHGNLYVAMARPRDGEEV